MRPKGKTLHMTSRDHSTDGAVRVVAIDPGGSRFGFAVREGQDGLIDWAREIRQRRSAHGMRRVIELPDYYQPYAMIVEDVSSKHVADRRAFASKSSAATFDPTRPVIPIS